MTRSSKKLYQRKVFTVSVFAFIAFAATAINPPLLRFPWQDLIWNDLVLLGRLAWLRSVLFADPFSSIDFLQGLGQNMRDDIKVIPHFYDPAVFFSFFTNDIQALTLRTFALNFYCLVGLNYLWKQQYGDREENSQRDSFRFPLFLFYVIAPQMMFEIGHHFSAIFLAIPGLVASLRSVFRNGTIASWMYFVAASTLVVHLSDVHIVFFAIILLPFLLYFDPLLGKVNIKQLAAVVLSFSLIIFCSYAALIFARLFGDGDEVVIAQGIGTPLGRYFQEFVSRAIVSLVVPRFAGPITLYIAPYIPIFILVALHWKKNRKLALRVVMLGVFLLGLFVLGAFPHSVLFFRQKLPSMMRYHYAIFPFLVNLWILFYAGELAVIVGGVKKRLSVLMGSMALFVLFGPFIYHIIMPLVTSAVMPGKPVPMATEIFGLVGYPTLFIFLVFYGKNSGLSNFRSFAKVVVFTTTVALSYYAVRIQINRSYVDRSHFVALFRDMPEAIDQLIKNSPYANMPRSVMPIAEPHRPGLTRGRNDKLLPLIEYPESFGARMFFNWRYSYTKHTSRLYSRASGHGPLVFFPPASQYIEETIDLAVKTDSPFLISADKKHQNERLIYIGSHEVPKELNNNKPGVNTEMVGDIHLYAVKPVVLSQENRAFESIRYSRAKVVFSGLRSKDKLIRLPMTYLNNIVIHNESGIAVEKQKGEDGFLYVENNGSFNSLTVGSFSPFAALPLATPLLGLLPMFFTRRRSRPYVLSQTKDLG